MCSILYKYKPRFEGIIGVHDSCTAASRTENGPFLALDIDAKPQMT